MSPSVPEPGRPSGGAGPTFDVGHGTFRGAILQAFAPEPPLFAVDGQRAVIGRLRFRCLTASGGHPGAGDADVEALWLPPLQYTTGRDGGVDSRRTRDCMPGLAVANHRVTHLTG